MSEGGTHVKCLAQGLVVWFTGLPAAGKSTLADAVALALQRNCYYATHLDADVLRKCLWPELGFSRSERDANVQRLAWLASKMAGAGAAVTVSAISPFEAARRDARSIIEPHSQFVLVHLTTPLSECARRDPKE